MIHDSLKNPTVSLDLHTDQSVAVRLTVLTASEQKHLWEPWQLCSVLRLLQPMTLQQWLEKFEQTTQIPYQIWVRMNPILHCVQA